jgi:DICT domain-containing protein
MVGDKNTWQITGIYNGSGEDIYKFYKEKFGSWTVENDYVTESEDKTKTYGLHVIGDKYAALLVFTETTEQVNFNIYVEER